MEIKIVKCIHIVCSRNNLIKSLSPSPLPLADDLWLFVKLFYVFQPHTREHRQQNIKKFVIAVDSKVEAENWNKADISQRILHIILLHNQLQNFRFYS